jgi:signal transduction histidine kinase/CheY-like chemotaxis protein
MSSNRIAKYLPLDILENQSSSLAVADNNQKIIWFNNSFKTALRARRLIGVSISKLFNLPEATSNKILNGKKHQLNNIPDKHTSLKITPLPSQNKTGSNYFLEIVPAEQTKEDSKQSKMVSQNDMQDVFAKLVKEASVDELADDILKKSVTSSGSDIGIVVFFDDGSPGSMKFYDVYEHLQEKASTEKTIRSDFKFIARWLLLNKQQLIALNDKKNIGYNLTQSLACNILLITPCILNEKLLAVIITGKKQGTYSGEEINYCGQFASILAFAIVNIHTRELNATLESRLLQAQKLETIGKLSSGMAHDFSNLLSSIFGSVNLLRKRVQLAEGTDKLIDNIENCSVRARDLTKGLLSFGKPTPKRKELVKPYRLLKEISRVVVQTFPRNINFAEDFEDNLTDILGNSTEIYQILLNLCVNAKEATEGKGTIKLSAKNVSIDRKNLLQFPLLKEGNYVCFSVSDNGSGIDEKNLTKIFDPYFSTKSKDAGSGLGLYVTYGIVKAHKGYIDVSSKLNEGTTFNVYIPTFEPPKEKLNEPSEKIIMLADDEPMLSDLLAELLESNGYNVIKVVSGEDVMLVLTEEIKVDLVIIDYNMPGKNGIDTIREIRNRNLNIPIILSTGSLKSEEEDKLPALNINDRIEKPYEFETMLSAIRKLI